MTGNATVFRKITSVPTLSLQLERFLLIQYQQALVFTMYMENKISKVLRKKILFQILIVFFQTSFTILSLVHSLFQAVVSNSHLIYMLSTSGLFATQPCLEVFHSEHSKPPEPFHCYTPANFYTCKSAIGLILGTAIFYHEKRSHFILIDMDVIEAHSVPAVIKMEL